MNLNNENSTLTFKGIPPDVRDGLNENERIILFCLHQLQSELKREFVPSIMLYGRVCEHLNITQHEFQKSFNAII